MIKNKKPFLPVSSILIFDKNYYMKILFLSLFNSGRLPKMPGTWGSLVSVIIFIFFQNFFPNNLTIKFILLILIFISIYMLAVKFIKEVITDNKYDKQWIVIDEFLGMMIACIPFFLFHEFSWLLLLSGFISFRLFDIWKPLGIKMIDKQNTPNAVILDDVLSGFYAFLLQMIILYLFFSGVFY